MSALLALWDGGRRTMTELAQRTSMSRAAITTLVDRLERGDYLLRVPDTSDRRRIFVMITPHFDQQLRNALAPFADATAELAGNDTWRNFAIIAAQLREDVENIGAGARQ